MPSFSINCYCVVLSTDISNNKKYILSIEPDKITLPSIPVTKDMIENTNQSLISYLKDLNVSEDDLSLMPQIICLHSGHIPSDENTINTVYGFLVDYNPDIKNAYWISFEYTQPNEYSNLIFEVIQKL
jgi:hypothetical protein